MNTKEINKGMVVQFKIPHYDLMTGTVERVFKFKGVGFDAKPSDNPNDWKYDVVVSSNHPRNSGIFQLNSDAILRVVK